jgi:hypothetical protein
VVCTVDTLDAVEELEADDEEDEVEEEYEVAARSTSSSRSDDAAFVDDPADPVDAVDAAVDDACGAVAANQAPRPRNDAALTAPVMRRARRAGCGFGFDFWAVVMGPACARSRKTT